MGALHAGHRSLLKRARQTSDIVVASIFVNPLQFGPSEDFARYPRMPAADLAVCREEGVDVAFLPSVTEIYPPDFQTSVSVDRLTRRWEGESRPAHFRGVTTVITKLLQLIRPHRIFLGQKDFQQCRVIQQLIKDLHFDISIAICPTVRESDGLALSSRNRYLTESQRQRATALYRSLQVGQTMIRNGHRSAPHIQEAMCAVLEAAPGVRIDYIAIADAETLEPVKRLQGKMKVVLLGAIRLGNVRLIDNLLIRVR